MSKSTPTTISSEAALSNLFEEQFGELVSVCQATMSRGKATVRIGRAIGLGIKSAFDNKVVKSIKDGMDRADASLEAVRDSNMKTMSSKVAAVLQTQTRQSAVVFAEGNAKAKANMTPEELAPLAHKSKTWGQVKNSFGGRKSNKGKTAAKLRSKAKGGDAKQISINPISFAADLVAMLETHLDAEGNKNWKIGSANAQKAISDCAITCIEELFVTKLPKAPAKPKRTAKAKASTQPRQRKAA